MKILITNDDRYRAKGLHSLAEIMSAYGDVTVIAPKYHQSAMGMAVSLGFKKLAFKELPDEKPGRWAYLDATPASCIKLGLNLPFIDRKPDVVITGINHGSNAASAACYSATLGAAEEGALNGIKSIGVSLCDFRHDADFTVVRKYLPAIFEMLLEHWPDVYGLMYNINFPAVAPEDVKGIRVARQGRGHWEKEFREWDPEVFKKYFITEELYGDLNDRHLEPGEKAYMMVGDFIDDEAETADADHRLNDEGWITITALNLDKTDISETARLRALNFDQDFKR